MSEENNVLNIKLKEEVESVQCDDVLIEEIDEMLKLAEKMITTSVNSGGVGLSGPQVGVNKKIIVWEHKPQIYQVAFNPRCYPTGKAVNAIEGCLSYPDEHYYVKRAKKIRAVYQTISEDRQSFKEISRDVSGEEAIILQHEISHVNHKNEGVGKTIAETGKKL